MAKDNNEVITAIRSSQKTKDTISKFKSKHGVIGANQFLEQAAIHQEFKNKLQAGSHPKWITIPYAEYDTLLSGQKSCKNENHGHAIGEFCNFTTIISDFVIQFCRDLKFQKGTNGKLKGQQHGDVLRFEDIYKVIEQFHKMNHIFLDKDRNEGTVKISSKHEIGKNFSTLLSSIFKQAAELSEEFHFVRDEIDDDSVYVYLELSDNVDMINAVMNKPNLIIENK